MAAFQGKTVLVTGASGFIGRRLTIALAQSGAAVTAVSRSTPPQALAGLPLRFVRADIADPAAMARLVGGQSIIFNLAHDVRATGPSNLAAFSTLVDAAERAGVERIVHLSSIVVYDNWPDGIVSEAGSTTAHGGGDYRLTKIAMETRLMRGLVPSAILQPTLVWGPGSALWTNHFVDRLERGATILVPEPEGLFQGVFVEDLVQACLRAALVSDLVHERFIINGPSPLAWSDLLQGYCTIAGRGAIRRMPAASLRPAAITQAVAQGPSAAARISAIARRAIGHERFEALVRRVRGSAQGGDMRPDAHLFDLMTSNGHCPPDLAAARLGYRPAFGLAEGLAALARQHRLKTTR